MKARALNFLSKARPTSLCFGMKVQIPIASNVKKGEKKRKKKKKRSIVNCPSENDHQSIVPHSEKPWIRSLN